MTRFVWLQKWKRHTKMDYDYIAAKMFHNKPNWLTYANSARITFCIALFFLTILPAYTDKLLFVALLFSLFEGNFLKRIHLIKENPITISLFIFLIIVIFGVFYGPASPHERLMALGRYTKLLYIFFIMHLFFDEKKREMAENFLLFGVTISIVVTLLYRVGWINIHSNLFSFMKISGYLNDAGYGQLSHSFFVFLLISGPPAVFCCFISMIRLTKKKNIMLNVGGVLFFSYYVLFINMERTTGLILILGILFISIQYFNWKILLATIISLLVSCNIAYHYSPLFQAKCSGFLTDGSIYTRIERFRSSIQSSKKNLLIGTGLYSFGYDYYQGTGGSLETMNKGPIVVTHPDSQYGLIFIELGTIGLASFVFWLYSLLKMGYYFKKNNRVFAQLLAISLILLCFTNAEIIMKTGLFYTAMIAIYFGNKAGD